MSKLIVIIIRQDAEIILTPREDYCPSRVKAGWWLGTVPGPNWTICPI